MYLNSNTVEKSFNILSALNVDNKFWGVLVILKNLQTHKVLNTQIGSLEIASVIKGDVQRNLKDIFAINVDPGQNRVVNTDKDFVLLRNDFETWMSHDLLNDQKIDALALAVFWFKNKAFENQPSAIDLMDALFAELHLENNWEKSWFKTNSTLDLAFDTVFKSDWGTGFSIGEKEFTIGATHKSIIFKANNGVYSTVAAPDELSRGPFYQPLYSAQNNALILIKPNFFSEEIHEENGDLNNTSENFDYDQIIYYGVPGCGKSHQVKEDLKAKGIPQNRTKRVVFHPDYCNADFVGQIMPETKKDGGVRYNFKAGPFAKILRVAYENPNFEYALIIEEINRGNAAAIFGDIFQLLDRKTRQEQTENLNGNTYGIGWSDYCVNNDYINAYFRGAYDGEIVDGPLPEKKLGNTTFNDNVDIRLPPNLSIYATMNTSDQNVFTLDNAFQRRWKMKQISNTLNCSDPKEAAQYNLTIGNSNVKWGKFREEINNKIVDPDYTSNFSSLEDKRLGGWFVVPEKEGDTFISKENFADKVIKFLWDDAFKFNRAIFGDYEKKSLELVIEAFVGDVGFGVFEENFRKCLNVAESSADQQSDGQS